MIHRYWTAGQKKKGKQLAISIIIFSDRKRRRCASFNPALTFSAVCKDLKFQLINCKARHGSSFRLSVVFANLSIFVQRLKAFDCRFVYSVVVFLQLVVHKRKRLFARTISTIEHNVPKDCTFIILLYAICSFNSRGGQTLLLLIINY